MRIVISPAKTLDFETPPQTDSVTQPQFLTHSQTLITQLRDYTPSQIRQLMGVSEKIASLNAERYQTWQTPFDLSNAKQAVLAFKGDVYQGLAAQTLNEDELQFAQTHLRILSGLYGLLRPLDLMQPYRLEMGTKLANARGENLYDFWGDLLTEQLNDELADEDEPVLLNLASNEYFNAIKKKALNARIISPVFKDYKNGKYKIISFYAKKARGLMVAFVIKNRLADATQLTEFDYDGYAYSAELSKPDVPVFLRDIQNENS